MYKILKNNNGKHYKQLARCLVCSKRYVVDKKSEVYQSVYDAAHYCKQCFPRIKKLREEERAKANQEKA